MNQNVRDVLEIINSVRNNFDASRDKYRVGQLRLNAVNSIARRRNVVIGTIAHSYIRSLKPYIIGTEQFDKLLNDWLFHDSSELYTIIYKFSNSGLKPLIEEAFLPQSEEDKVLASEFGFEFIDKTFIEGKDKLRLHLTKERNQHLIREAKSQWAETSKGNIKCGVCDFSFSDFYGDLGKSYIEAHHSLPLSTLTKETVMKISDLVPVCSNCHSMLHRNTKTLTIEHLRKVIKRSPIETSLAG